MNWAFSVLLWTELILAPTVTFKAHCVFER